MSQSLTRLPIAPFDRGRICFCDAGKDGRVRSWARAPLELRLVSAKTQDRPYECLVDWETHAGEPAGTPENRWSAVKSYRYSLDAYAPYSRSPLFISDDVFVKSPLSAIVGGWNRTQTSIFVPLFGAELISNRPSTRCTRSRMLRMPRPSLFKSSLSSNPWP